MRRRRAVPAFLALLALVAASASACSSSSGATMTSSRVDPVQATTLHAGDITLRIPAGAASGGTVTLTAATPPERVPPGLKPLGPAAAVLLAGGSLAAPATLTFPVPAGLQRGDLPVVVWRTGTGWTWLPTSWRNGDRTAQVAFTRPSAGYLAEVQTGAWVQSLRKAFVDRVTTAADASPPYCAGQGDAVAAGLTSGSDPGSQVRWCVGVEDGSPVLRVTNETKLVTEVTFPETWTVAAQQGATGAAVRSALGFGTPPPVGRAARYLGGGETLTLHPVGSSGTTPPVVGDVTAEVTSTAWAVSALLAAADAYAAVVTRADPVLGDAATTAADGLPHALGVGLPPGSGGQPSLRAVRDCLAPVRSSASSSTAGGDTLGPEVARALLRAAFHCAPHYFARTMARTGAPADGVQLADHVGKVVVNGLVRALLASAADWSAFPGTTKASAYRIWLGPPPPRQLDYDAAPVVFRVDSPVHVPQWTPAFQAYVRERLDYLVTNSDTGSDTAAGCADGTFTVRRYRSDGFALAGQVSCGGVPHQLVLVDLADGWHEVDDTEAAADDPDVVFDCGLMRLYSVPPFIAGDRCSSGSEVQDYP